MPAFLLWIAAALVLGVIEILTLDLIFVMFAGGAIAAAITGGFGAAFWVQIIVFAVASALLLGLLRPWGLRILFRKGPKMPTNVEAHVGRNAVVVSEVSHRGGRIKLVGEVWTARAAEDGVTFAIGRDVQVLRIEGAKAIVQSAAPIDNGET